MAASKCQPMMSQSWRVKTGMTGADIEHGGQGGCMQMCTHMHAASMVVRGLGPLLLDLTQP